MTEKDKVFADKKPHIVDFKFDETVSRVFPDMIRRSVPSYESIIELTGSIAEKYAQPQSSIYDLGCSLGASTLSMFAREQYDSLCYYCVDNSPEMLSRCQENLKFQIPDQRLNLTIGNVEDCVVENASVVVMNFTLQFVEPALRQGVLDNIFNGMRNGGAFVLSEKIDFENEKQSKLMNSLHEQFKISNGYSELEISQKRSALENVMVLDSEQKHFQRLNKAGFSAASKWFQCVNFASFIGIK